MQAEMARVGLSISHRLELLPAQFGIISAVKRVPDITLADGGPEETLGLGLSLAYNWWPDGNEGISKGATMMDGDTEYQIPAPVLEEVLILSTAP